MSAIRFRLNGVERAVDVDPDRSLLVQCAAIMATVTTTELFGLSLYAGAARWLARRFASPTFAVWFNRGAAGVMAASALFALWSTWTASTGWALLRHGDWPHSGQP